MTTAKLIAIFVSVAASVAVACPNPIQDVAEANRILAHLTHRKTKADADGRIVYLDISEQDSVNDDTLKVVSHLPHLKEFYAIWCPINGDGLAHFTSLRELEKLDLYATQIDDRALKHIAHIKTLKYLDLCATSRRGPGMIDSYSSITDEGLSKLATLPNLETLRITGQFSDNGVKQLVALKKLKHLDLHSPNITPATMQWLQKKTCPMWYWNDGGMGGFLLG